MALSRDFGFGPDEQLVRDQARKLAARERTGRQAARAGRARPPRRLRERGAARALGRGAVEADGRARLDGARRARSPRAALGMKTIVGVALVRGDRPRRGCRRRCRRRCSRPPCCARPARPLWLEKIAGGDGRDARDARRSGLVGAGRQRRRRRAPRAAASRCTARRRSCRTRARRACSWSSARGEGGIGLYVVPSRRARRDGRRPTASSTSRATRRRSTLRRRPGRRGRRRRGAAARARPRSRPRCRRILTLLAADLCGAAEWQLQTTAEYAKGRVAVRAPDRLLPGRQAPDRERDARRSTGRAR